MPCFRAAWIALIVLGAAVPLRAQGPAKATPPDRLLLKDFRFRAEMYRACFRVLETDDEHFYARNIGNYHWPLYGLGLSEEVLKKVYCDNARRILRAAK
jgi:hypothetical protein